MKSLQNRIERLEKTNSPDRLTGFDIVIVNTEEQVKHPERFRKVLDSEETSETGFTRRMFHYEREEPNKT